MSNNGCTVVVTTADKRADVWGPFFRLFDRYWPGCPYARAVVGETRGPNLTGWRELLGGKVPWSDLLRAALNTIKTDWVLLFMDDFMMTEHVNSAEVERALLDGQAFGAECVRLSSRPGGERFWHGTLDIVKRPEWLISHQVAFWRRETLAALLREGETCWDQEAASGTRGPEILRDKVLVAKQNVVNYLDSIQAGRWKRQARALLRHEGMEIAGSRPIISWNNSKG